MEFKTERKYAPLPPRIHLILFLAIFFGSIIFANVCCYDEIFWMGFQTDNLLRQFAVPERSLTDLIQWFLKNRCVIWISLCVIGYFYKSKFLFLIPTGWFGCSGGIVFTALIQHFGLKSFLLLPVLLLPHLPLYLIAYVLLIKNTLHRNGGYPVKCLLFSCIYTGGVLCEYYCNPWLLETLCRLFEVMP